MSTPALAEPSPALDRFSFSVGAFHAEPTLDAGLKRDFDALSSTARLRVKLKGPSAFLKARF